MFQNYLTIALRNLLRQKGYAVINIAGLALGLACCILIGLYVRDEVTYDHFHESADRTFLVRAQVKLEASGQTLSSNLPPSVKTLLVETAPEVERAVAVYDPDRVIVSLDAEPFYEDGLLYTDPSFFEVFDFPLLRGDAKTALAQPGSVVLTPRIAQKYFGDEDPIGQSLTVSDSLVLEVTGLLRPIPSNTQLQFDLLASLETLRPAGAYVDNGQIGGQSQTYLVLGRPTAEEGVNQQIKTLLAESGTRLAEAEPVLIPLKSLHFDGFGGDGSLGGNQRYVYIFGIIALLILLIACVNFTNLTTAQALRRAREVGIRKTVGAKRTQLVQQFLGETLFYSFVAVVVAVACVEFVLPAFNAVVGKHLQVVYLGAGSVLPWLALLWFGTALMAGSYPALMLSGFNPMTTLKGFAETGLHGLFLRRALVVFQFTISIALIIGLLVIQRQLDHLQAQSLGMQPDQVIVLGRQGQAATNPAAFKQAVRDLPGVRDVTLTNFPQSFGFPTTMEGQTEQSYASTILVDADFLRVLHLNVEQGRGFDPTQANDFEGSVLINETAAKTMGWTDALGKKVERLNMKSSEFVTSEVIGVVEDFPARSLKYEQQPVVLILTDDAAFGGSNALARLDADQIPETLAALQALWTKFAPTHPFEYAFLDERFDALYRAEQQLRLLLGTFAALAVLIACLGLFGLAVYTAERRAKEIGIRKVLGASVPSLVTLLSKEFALLVLAAFVIATPLAYVAMQRWLEDFAYRTDIGAGVFLLAGGLALLITLLTVGYQAVRAALADPVKSLRYE